jgi:hypothetical protein
MHLVNNDWSGQESETDNYSLQYVVHAEPS